MHGANGVLKDLLIYASLGRCRCTCQEGYPLVSIVTWSSFESIATIINIFVIYCDRLVTMNMPFNSYPIFPICPESPKLSQIQDRYAKTMPKYILQRFSQQRVPPLSLPVVVGMPSSLLLIHHSRRPIEH